ncbi:MAG TPA: PAS domain-containing protein, partial [Syntrophomonadaceae bacterium]|nr:PAS domain-containing protein [Syntrophomonadaceae bacterium]
MNLPDSKLNYPIILSHATVADVAALLQENKAEYIQINDGNGAPAYFLDRTSLLKIISMGMSSAATIQDLAEKHHLIKDIQPDNENSTDLSEDESILYEELRRENEQLKKCLDSIYNPVIAVDEQSRIKIFNKSAEKLLFYSAEQANGRNIYDVLPNSRLPDVIQTGEIHLAEKLSTSDRTFIS